MGNAPEHDFPDSDLAVYDEIPGAFVDEIGPEENIFERAAPAGPPPRQLRSPRRRVRWRTVLLAICASTATAAGVALAASPPDQTTSNVSRPMEAPAAARPSSGQRDFRGEDAKLARDQKSAPRRANAVKPPEKPDRPDRTSQPKKASKRPARAAPEPTPAVPAPAVAPPPAVVADVSPPPPPPPPPPAPPVDPVPAAPADEFGFEQ